MIRWFVRYRTPEAQCTDMGSLPGYVLLAFGVVISRVVRGGEVKRSFSRGSRTKVLSGGPEVEERGWPKGERKGSSITQLGAGRKTLACGQGREEG